MRTMEEANQRMFDFIERNITSIDELTREGQNFHISKGGIEFLLIATTSTIKSAANFIDELKRNGKGGIPTAVLSVRSTSDYQGELLKPAVYAIDGKNRYWGNKKYLTKFEQALVELYGPIPYYNPSKDYIQLIRFIRMYRIPLNIQRLKDSKDPKKRQKFHIHENLREKTRKISIKETIRGPFTLEPYERKRKPLVARIVPYQPQ